MKVVIAGGGIAGLATGIAVRQAGHEVQILERSRELREIGAGLMIWPNGARSLRALGVEVDGLIVREMSVCGWSGRRLGGYSLGPISDRYRFDTSFVHRADLQAALAGRFGAKSLCLGAEVVGFEQQEQAVRVLLRDGTSITADALIGADGLRSSVRRLLLNDGDPAYLGSTIWRGTVQSDGIGIPQRTGVNWIGRGAEFLGFHVRGDQIYWAGVTKEPRGESPGTGGHKADLKQRFGSWAEPVRRVIEATDDSSILRNDMYDRPPARRWSVGRVSLVGDAAHPMTPNAGQGACQALEDARVVGECFRQASDPTAAFATYEKRRLRQANWVVGLSRQATRGVQLENRLLCAVRDNVGYLVAQLAYTRMLDRILA